MKPFLAALVMTPLLAAGPSHAAEWRESAHAKDGTIYSYDSNSLKAAADFQTLWIKVQRPKADEDGATSSLARYRFVCSAMSYTMLSIISHRPDGTVAYSRTLEPFEQKAQIAAPETVFERVMNDMCAEAGVQ